MKINSLCLSFLLSLALLFSSSCKEKESDLLPVDDTGLSVNERLIGNYSGRCEVLTATGITNSNVTYPVTLVDDSYNLYVNGVEYDWPLIEVVTEEDRVAFYGIDSSPLIYGDSVLFTFASRRLQFYKREDNRTTECNLYMEE